MSVSRFRIVLAQILHQFFGSRIHAVFQVQIFLDLFSESHGCWSWPGQLHQPLVFQYKDRINHDSRKVCGHCFSPRTPKNQLESWYATQCWSDTVTMEVGTSGISRLLCICQNRGVAVTQHHPSPKWWYLMPWAAYPPSGSSLALLKPSLLNVEYFFTFFFTT